MIKISVVIPAYNEENFIKGAIESIKKQNFSKELFEIIVVDNNSTDKTKEIALSAGADLVLLEKESGANMARNCGLLHAKGEIIAFLDADCSAPKEWFNYITNSFEKDFELMALSGPYDHEFRGIKKYLDVVYSHYLLPRVPKILDIIFNKKAGVIIGGNFAVRKSIINKIGKFPKVIFFGDDASIAMVISRKAGKVFYDKFFIVKSSDRRFYNNGTFLTVSRYIYSYLKMYFISPK